MSLGKFAELDAATRGRIDAACNFINHKVDELRRRVLLVACISAVAAMGVWVLSGWDFRLPFGAALVVTVLVFAHGQRELSRWYKSMVIRRIVEAVGQGLRYSEQSSLGKDTFRAIDLYQERIDKWHSEDEIAGSRNDVDYALHEVVAQRREQRGKNSVLVTFFKGYVVVLEFNKNFLGHTIVVPDRSAKIMGGLFGQADSRGAKQLISLANADFEQAFAVYATDQQEAHYLLTPRLMELVLRARAHFDSDLRLAFYQNSLYVTLPSREDRFEVSLFGGKISPLTVMGDLAAVVDLAHQLIDTFDLETRIWSRT